MRRYTLFIAVGVVVVGLVGSYYFAVTKKQVKAKRDLEQVKKSVETLKNLADSPDQIPVVAEIDEYRKARDRVYREYAEAIVVLMKSDENLERFFPSLKDVEGVPADAIESIYDPAREDMLEDESFRFVFPQHYREASKKLLEETRKNIGVADMAFSFATFPSGIPTRLLIERAQKRFWIQKLLAELLCQCQVVQLDRIAIRGIGVRGRVPLCEVIQVDITVSIRFQQLDSLLRHLLSNNRLLMRVRDIKVVKPTTVMSRTAGSGTERKETSSKRLTGQKVVSAMLSLGIYDPIVVLEKAVFHSSDSGAGFSSLDEAKQWMRQYRSRPSVKTDPARKHYIDKLYDGLTDKIGEKKPDEMTIVYMPEGRVEHLLEFTLEGVPVTIHLGKLKK